MPSPTDAKCLLWVITDPIRTRLRESGIALTISGSLYFSNRSISLLIFFLKFRKVICEYPEGRGGDDPHPAPEVDPGETPIPRVDPRRAIP